MESINPVDGLVSRVVGSGSSRNLGAISKMVVRVSVPTRNSLLRILEPGTRKPTMTGDTNREEAHGRMTVVAARLRQMVGQDHHHQCLMEVEEKVYKNRLHCSMLCDRGL